MKVHELIAWLQDFEDQEATVMVLHCEESGSPYGQGGITRSVVFNPGKHVERTDLRDNPFARTRGYTGPLHEVLFGLKEA